MALKESTSYYTVAQVKKILGITNEMLYNYVENGALERIIPPGKKQGVYRRSQVDQLARDLQSFMVHRNRKPTVFERVKTREEMEKCLEITQELFGVGDGLADENMGILEKNPETYYMLKDENQIIGFSILWPIKPERLDNILKQTLPVKAMPDDIETFEYGKSVDIYIATLAIKPTFTRAERHSYGSRLISGVRGVMEKLGERGITINTITARSNTPDGIRLMRGIGFSEVKAITPERRTFIIEVEKSAIPFVQKYQEALEKSKGCTQTTEV